MCSKVCYSPCCYLKHGITKDVFIALQSPVRVVQVLWLACLCNNCNDACIKSNYWSVTDNTVCLSTRNYTCDLHQIFGACSLRSLLSLSLVKRTKSATIALLLLSHDIFVCFDPSKVKIINCLDVKKLDIKYMMTILHSIGELLNSNGVVTKYVVITLVIDQ